MILDLYSRYVVGWRLANRETSEIAQELITNAIVKQNIDPTQLTVHSDSKNGYASCFAWEPHRKGQACQDSWWLAVSGGLTHTLIDVAVIPWTRRSSGTVG